MAVNLTDEFSEDLHTLLNAVTGLTGGLWKVRGETSVYPYATYFFYATVTDKDTEKKHYEFYMQISVFHQGDTATTAEAVAWNLQDALDEAEGSFSLTGHTVTAIDNVVPPKTTKDNHKTWHTYSQFRIKITKD